MIGAIGRRRRLRRAGYAPVGLLTGCVLIACLLAGCTSARADLGTSDSSCYLALPSATKAAGPHSRLLGVHLFTADDLRKQAPHLYDQVGSPKATGPRLCVLAFSGHFTKSSVSMPRGRPSGPVAVTVLSSPSNHLLGTVILRRIPLRFAHSHIG